MRGKKLLTVLLAVVLLVACMPIGAVSVSAASNGVVNYTIANGQVTITKSVNLNPVHLEIPDTIEGYPVTAIAHDAFNACKTLVSAVIPDSVTSLGNHVFFDCPNLKKVDVGDGVTVIPLGIFWYCEQLEEVVLGKSVTTIQDNTFMGCSSLTKLYVGVALKSVSHMAFSAPKLTDVYYAGTKADRNKINFGFFNEDFENATWHYEYNHPADNFDKEVKFAAMETTQGNGLAFRFTIKAIGVRKSEDSVIQLDVATIRHGSDDCKVLGMGALVTNDPTMAQGGLTVKEVNGGTVQMVPAVYMQEAEPKYCTFAARVVDIPDNQVDTEIFACAYYLINLNGLLTYAYGPVASAKCSDYM